MGYRKTKEVLAMANLLINTRPDASSAEVMRKAASMLRDIAEERAHLTQPAQAVDVGAIREVIAGLRDGSAFRVYMLEEWADKLTRALSGEKAGPVGDGWRPIETAPYATNVLAWLYLPKNPRASDCVVAQRVYVEKDDGPEYPDHQRITVGCWWANGRYYAAGHVTHWMPLPASPTPDKEGA